MADSKDIINELGGTERRLNDMHAIKELLKDGTGGGSYSTDEKKVGKWIDGSEIYCKTIVCDHNGITLTGIENAKVINIDGAFITTVGAVIGLNATDGNNRITTQIQENGKQVNVQINGDWLAYIDCVIVRIFYVKGIIY